MPIPNAEILMSSEDDATFSVDVDAKAATAAKAISASTKSSSESEYEYDASVKHPLTLTVREVPSWLMPRAVDIDI